MLTEGYLLAVCINDSYPNVSEPSLFDLQVIRIFKKYGYRTRSGEYMFL